MYWTKVLDEKWYFARGFLPRSRLYFRGSESEPSVGGRGCTCLIPTTIPNCSASASISWRRKPETPISPACCARLAGTEP